MSLIKFVDKKHNETAKQMDDHLEKTSLSLKEKTLDRRVE